MTMWFEYDGGELYLYSNTDFEVEDGTLKMQLTEENEVEEGSGTWVKTELTHAGDEARMVFNEVLAEMAPYS